MKILNVISKTLWVSAAAALVIGCSDVIPQYDSDSTENSGFGYLSFANLSLSVDSEQESFSDYSTSETNTSVASSDDVELLTTKAQSEAGDDHIVKVLSESTGEEVYKATYADAKSEESPIKLSAGSYIVQSTTNENIAGAAWEQPEYTSKDQTITVGNELVTEISELVCYLANIKTTVSLSGDILTQFKTKDMLEDGDTPLTVTLSLGDYSLEYAEDETRAGYFAEQEDDSSISILLEGMYNIAAADETANYVSIKWEEQITGVAAGQSRNISIKIDNYNDGKITISMEVQTWVYDSPLGVSLFSQSFLAASEDTIIDPDDQTTDLNAPVLTLDGMNVEDTYTISETLFDFDAESYSPTYKATLTPADGATVEYVEFRVSSSNNSFISAMEAAGYTDCVIPVWDEDSSNSALSDYMTIREDGDNLTITMKYTGMNALYGYAGTHEVLVYAVDNSGRRMFTTLTLSVVAEGGVSVVWRTGEDGTVYDFDTRYDIYPTGKGDNPSIILDITTPTGITAMTVNIISDVLTPEELGTMSLAQSMDLINPETDEMASILSVLGFPVGDEVDGATEVELNITNFMPTLAGLAASVNGSTSDFEITVSDASSTVVETIKVVVVKDESSDEDENENEE